MRPKLYSTKISEAEYESLVYFNQIGRKVVFGMPSEQFHIPEHQKDEYKEAVKKDRSGQNFLSRTRINLYDQRTFTAAMTPKFDHGDL